MKYWLPILCISLLLLTAPTKAMAYDWPSPFRDATNRNSVSEQPILPLAKVGEISNQGIRPVVEGNVLVTLQADGAGQKIVAYRLTTQDFLWEYSLGSQIPRQPVIYRGTVYFGILNHPVVYGLSLLTGELRWQNAVPNETIGLKFAPIGVDDGLFVVGKSLHRLSTLDGQEKWSLAVVIDSLPAADSRYLYLRRHDLKLSQVDIESGQVTWSVATGTTIGTVPVVTGNTVYVGTFRTILAIEKSSGQLRWQYTTTGQTIGNLAVAGSLVLFNTNFGDVTALDDTGHLIWTNRFNAGSYSGNGWLSDFLIAGDSVAIQADESRYLFLNGLTGEQIDFNQLPDPTAKIQAISDHKVLASTSTKLIIYTAIDWLTGNLGDPVEEKRIDPVIVIPGMIESWPVNGVWRLDPVFKMFDNLLNTFRQAGYSDDLTLFQFPYDWHVDNTETAHLLAQKIAAIRAQTGASKVDIVAHSMGGLVARSYLQSDYYNNDVDQFIGLAVPNHGSVKSYLTWEAAETGPSVVDLLKEKLLDHEATQNGFKDNTFGYIHSRLPTVGQLLPTFDYLEKNGQLTPYFPCNQQNYPCNPFLESLNSQIDRLVSRVSSYNIVAQLRTNATLERLVVENTAVGNLWAHGMPRNYPQADGMVNGLGDQTVLSQSAHLDGVPEKILQSDHGSIVTDAAALVVKTLSDKNTALVAKPTPLRFLFIQLFSHAKMLLSDDQDHRVGSDPQTGQRVNTIADAYYDETLDKGGYAIIPNPPDANYTLSVDSPTVTDYTVTGSLIEDDSVTESTVSGSTDSTVAVQYDVKVKPQAIAIEPAVSPIPCISPATVSIRAP
jgi:outer membrane protein assembly factor BamB